MDIENLGRPAYFRNDSDRLDAVRHLLLRQRKGGGGSGSELQQVSAVHEITIS
jgi:hypothetical protein